MRIDEIAKNYMQVNNLDYLMIDDLNSFHAIYDIYLLQKTYKKPKRLYNGFAHPLDVLHAVSRALARSKLFYVEGKCPTYRGALNMYKLVDMKNTNVIN